MNQQLIALCKRELIDIYKSALDAIKPERLLRDAVTFSEGNLIVRDIGKTGGQPYVFPLQDKRIHVIGGGKCTLAMAKGLAELANQRHTLSSFSHGCISVPLISQSAYEADADLQQAIESIDVECKFGAKDNLPDAGSVSATETILERISEACRSDESHGLGSLFIVLISGGGSACLSSPRHLSLADKTATIKKLVQEGKDIIELNKVRRYFSNVKGGNLALHIKRCSQKAQILTLIISDVINDPVEFIASGPTFLSREIDQPGDEVKNIMSKYGLQVPELQVDMIHRAHENTSSIRNVIIGNNQRAIDAAVAQAEVFGYRVRKLGNNLNGDTADVMRMVLAAHDIGKSKKVLTICGGEATVRRLDDETWGLGGRTQEMALDYMISRCGVHSEEQSELVDILLAGSTDGQDGPTDVAGCMASRAEWMLDRSFSLEDMIRAKKQHDSYNFWTKSRRDWLIKTGSTGTNVMDLYLLATIEKSEFNLQGQAQPMQ